MFVKFSFPIRTLLILLGRCRVTIGFVEAGGVVPEKFNAVEASANIDAEYGNQGTDFVHVPREGFGWSV